VCELADALYRRADWQWPRRGGHGHARVEAGGRFLPHRWWGYNEARSLSPGPRLAHAPLAAESYTAYTSPTVGRASTATSMCTPVLYSSTSTPISGSISVVSRRLYAGPRHRLLRKQSPGDYVHQQYAIRIPSSSAITVIACWGLTASDALVRLRFSSMESNDIFMIIWRGAPIRPGRRHHRPVGGGRLAAVYPGIVLPMIQHMIRLGVGRPPALWLAASFNPTFPAPTGVAGWISPWNYGLNQGPLVLMIENYRSGLIWSLMRRCPYLVAGLRQAGFSGGWLGIDCGEPTAKSCKNRIRMAAQGG